MQLSLKDKSVILGYFVLLMVLLISRGLHVPLTPDEAFSYFLYIEPGYFTAPYAQLDANNHLLNSILSWVSTSTFGHSTFALRLPNILAFVLFFFSNIGIAKQHSNTTLFWISVISLTSIYPLFEFFSLSRGYGLSFAFLSFGIYTVLLFQKEQKPIRFLWITLAFVGGLLSQLSLLFVFFALAIIVIVVYAKSTTKKLVTTISFAVYTLLFIVLLYLFIQHILFLNKLELLYYGDSSNFPFYNSETLIDILIHHPSKSLAIVFLCMCVGLCIWTAYLLFRYRFEAFQKPHLVFGLLLSASVLATLIAVYGLKTPGPTDRTALYFLYLTIGGMLFFPLKKFKLNLIIPCLTLFIPIRFLSNMTTDSVYYWEQEAIDNELFSTLYNLHDKESTVAGSKYLDRVFYAKYNFDKGYSPYYHKIQNHSSDADFVLLTQSDYKQFNTKNQYSVLWNKREKGVLLLQKTHTCSSKTQQQATLEVASNNSDYIATHSFYLDSVSTKGYTLDITLNLQTEASGSGILWTLSFFNKLGEVLENRYLSLNSLKRNWNDKKETNILVPLVEIPDKTYEIRAYIYNPHQSKYSSFQVNYTLQTLNCD